MEVNIVSIGVLQHKVKYTDWNDVIDGTIDTIGSISYITRDCGLPWELDLRVEGCKPGSVYCNLKSSAYDGSHNEVVREMANNVLGVLNDIREDEFDLVGSNATLMFELRLFNEDFVSSLSTFKHIHEKWGGDTELGEKDDAIIDEIYEKSIQYRRGLI